MAVAQTPTFLYDRDCTFCRAWVERWRIVTGDRVAYVAYQEWAQSSIPLDQLARASHLVDSDGAVYRGAEAVFRALATNPDAAWFSWLYRYAPGFAAVSSWAYGWVSQHRVAAARTARVLWGGPVPPSYELTRALFLRGLALIYAIAFASFWFQADGLIGSRGIWPLARYMRLVHENLGGQAWTQMPTVFLLGSGDGFIHAVCAAGVVLAVVLATGLWPRAALLGLWALYLSLEHAGYVFLGYQWDLLLLEAGLVAIPFAPRGVWPARGRRPVSWAALWLVRWLLFRLMFMSGMVKLLSGDPTWRDLTALQFHYWTQPLPTWLAAAAHDMSPSFLTFSCAVMFFIELRLPFFMFGVRWMRLVAFAGLAFLQVVILLTGNYGFFNWLTLVLCLSLLDDSILGRLRRKARGAAPARKPTGPVERWVRRSSLALFAAVYVAAGAGEMFTRLGKHGAWVEALDGIAARLSGLRSVNGYGLFAVMTPDRPEIVVEGSADGVTWRAYEFKWKPGRLDRAPGFVAPHQPRLDWQMWFAALGRCRHNPWFLEFQQKLLEGSRPVLELMAENPFKLVPPKYVRSTLYQYRFASPAERQRGQWWTRTEVGPYCPELTLEGGALQAVP